MYFMLISNIQHPLKAKGTFKDKVTFNSPTSVCYVHYIFLPCFRSRVAVPGPERVLSGELYKML